MVMLLLLLCLLCPSLALAQLTPGAPGHVIQDEGTALRQQPYLNFVGAGSTCIDDPTNHATKCTISSGVSAAYATIKDEGTSLTQRSVLNFIGSAVTCADNSGATRTDCTFTAGTGTLTGSGTTATIPVWASSSSLGDSGLTDNGSVLTVNRGYRGKVAAKSADYTLTTADYQIDCTAGSGGITLTLPSASGLTGQHYVIYKVDTDVGACTISPNGSDLLNGVNGAVTSLTTAYAGLDITQVSSTAWTVTSLGPLTIGDTIAASTDASVLTVGTGGVLGQVTPGTDGKVFTMVSGVPAWATAAGGVAVGDTVTSGTAGSVLYLGTSGVLAQDNAHLFYDPTVKQVLVGTNNPTPGSLDTSNFPDLGLSRVLVAAQSGDTPYASLSVVGASRTTALNLIGMGGTLASPAATPADTQLNLNFFATDATYGNIIAIVSAVSRGDQSVSGAGELGFYTSNATFTVYERSRITSAGTTGVDASACTANGSTHCLAGQVEVQSTLIQNAALTNSAKTTLNNFVTDLTYTANRAASIFGYVFELDFSGNHNYGHITIMDIQGGSNMDSGNISLATGLLVAPTFGTGGTLGTMIGIDVEATTATSANVKYGILVEGVGAATDAYGIYIDNPGGGGGAGHDYSLYAVGDGYFGGTLYVDATSGFDASTKLGVSGQMEVQGGILSYDPTNRAGLTTSYYGSYSAHVIASDTSNQRGLDLVGRGDQYIFFETLRAAFNETAANNTVQSGDPLGIMGWSGFAAMSGVTMAQAAQLAVIVDGSVDAANNRVPGRFEFSTTTTAGVSTVALKIDAKQHLVTAGTAPTVAGTTANACGTTSPSVAGTDHAGKVTVGATAGTSCTVTFAKTFATAPSCTVTNETTANLVRATSTTSTVILAGTMVASDKLAYVCLGY